MIDPGGSTAVRIVAGLSALGLVAAACAKNQQPAVSVAGAIGFDQNVASIANGPIPAADPGLACGSRTDSFGVELLHKKPTAANVLREWGEIIPGQQMFVSGKVANVVFSSGDLTFTHPFNLDFTFDVKPDPAFAKLAQQVGTGEREGGPPGTIHMEISQGLIPHRDPSSLNDFLPGFIPSVGDRVAAYGRWIIDCGHDDYHTEIHPTTFLAFSHTEGSSTVVHTFYNPYYETQLYTPNASLPAELENPNRLLEKETRPFPAYLFHQILRLVHVGDPGPSGYLDHLEAHHLLEANRASPISWYQCAPRVGRSGGSVTYSYHFVVRPGVTITTDSKAKPGCVRITAKIGRSYTPLDPQRKDCVDPWAELNQQAQAASGTRMWISSPPSRPKYHHRSARRSPGTPPWTATTRWWDPPRAKWGSGVP